MNKGFFEISSPRDLYDKAKGDFQIMTDETSTDTVFNYFVTTYHVMDYVKSLGTIPNDDIKQIYKDDDFKMCQYLCNKGKHFKLRSVEPYEAKHLPEVPGGVLGSFVLDSDQLGAKEKFVILDNGKEVNVMELGERLIKLWDKFFRDHNI